MELTRKYRDDEQPRVGDLIECFEGAYGVGIVTKIYGNPINPASGDEIIVERIHATVSFGQIAIGVERISYTHTHLRMRPVLLRVPNGDIDNRDRTP